MGERAEVTDQDPATEPSGTEPSIEADAVAEPQPASAAAGWLAFKVDGIDFKGGGRIDGLFVDAESRQPTWIAIRLTRFGRRTAVPFDWVAPGIGRVWIPCERATLKSAPSVDPGSPMTIATECDLIVHFALGEGGRAAELAERGDDEVGSIPG